MYDIIVIGAGPAGLTAAIYALRANKSVLILEKSTFGGQMTYSPKIENYPGFEQISGNELADRMIGQVLALGGEIELEEVTAIKKGDGFKTVVTEEGERTAKAVIAAVGVKHRMLGLEGEGELVGKGISFCAVCDGAFFTGKKVAVIGGGNSALQEAMLLSETCSSVTVIQNLDFLTGEKKLADALEARGNVNFIYGAVVTRLIGEDELRGIEIEKTDGEREELDFDGMFIAIGLEADNSVVSPLTSLDENGYVISDESCTADTEGIFVAGDCRRKSLRQITTAAADGAAAAISACRYLG